MSKIFKSFEECSKDYLGERKFSSKAQYLTALHFFHARDAEINELKEEIRKRDDVVDSFFDREKARLTERCGGCTRMESEYALKLIVKMKEEIKSILNGDKDE